MTDLFLVYGTLKRNQGNNRFLKDSKYVGKGLTLGNYVVYHSGFPMAVPQEEGLPLLGELYKVTSPDIVASLDQLEGNGRFYTRVVRKVKIIDFFEEEVNAWVYEVPKNLFGGATYCPVNTEYNAYEWKR